MDLSVVIPLYNEEGNIRPLLDGINAALRGYEFEVVMVDDGSTDRTAQEIKRHTDHRMKLVVLANNFGQTTAMAAGINEAVGKYVVTMDGDLPNDLSDIPSMIQKLEVENWDVVAGNRKNRQDNTFLRKLQGSIANTLIRRLTNVQIQDYGSTLKVFK